MRNNAYYSFAEKQFTAYKSQDIHVILLKMSWCKDSASVSLGGLTVREAAKGALLCEEFQKMPDPLFKVQNFISLKILVTKVHCTSITVLY